MSVVRLRKKTCNHMHLIAAVVESGLVDAEGVEIKVEFQRTTFTTTSALAQLCAWGLARTAHGCTFRFRGDEKALRYPERVGLFKHLSFDYPETPPRDDEGERFIPLRLLTDRGASLGEAVKAVRDLVSLHVQGSESFLPALEWVVRELTDNVGNHAESATPGVLCAQLYPNKKQVEFAIADMGRGIKASLASRYPKLWSHGDAITKALEPGVTRDLAAGQGNGLSGSQEIVMANGGELHIWSGGTDLAFVQQRRKGFRPGPEFPGTGIQLALRTNHPVDLRSTTIVDAEARNLYEIRRPDAEAPPATLLLAEVCSHVGGREPGKALREQVEAETDVAGPAPRPVVLDFAGAGQPSSSFLDEVFGRFADQHGREHYERLLELRNANDLICGMIARVVFQRLNPMPEETPARNPVTPRQREAMARVCAAKTAVYFGGTNAPGLEEAWTDLFGGEAEDFHRIHLAAGWREVLKSKLATLEGPVLLLPAWETLLDAQSAFLEEHNSVAAVLVSAVRDLVADGRSFELLLPTVLVSSQRDVELRNNLWELDLLRTVVSFSMSLGPCFGIRSDLSLLHLASPRPHEQPHAVAMIDGDLLVTDEKLRRGQLTELRGLLEFHGSGGELGYRFTWEDPSRPLRYASHDPTVRRHEAELGEQGGTVSLSELEVAVLSGSAGSPHLRLGNGATVPHPAISGRDLRSLDALSAEELEEAEISADSDLEAQLQTGDVLVGSVRRAGDPLRIGVLPEALAGTVAKHGVHVLRFADETVRDFVVDYLHSAFVRRWLDGEVAGVRIPLGKLRELPVPAPDGRIAKLVDQLSRTSSDLRRVADNFDDQRRALFSTMSLSLRDQLIESEETSLLATTLNHGLSAIDDPFARVRLLFPLPLALAWREMEIEKRPRQRYDGLLKVFEAAMVYLAVMLVSDMRHETVAVDSVGRLLEAFARPARGPTLGDWVQIPRQVPSMTPAEALESSSFPELRVLLSEDQERSDWWRMAGALLDRRNDLSHRRGPQSDGQFAEEIWGAENELQDLFARLGFLARYRLTEVGDCTLDALTEARVARIKELMGDHPAVAEKRVPVDRELGRGMYFSNARSGLTLCSPWMEYAECPECGNWEVTVPEFSTEEANGSTCYKSLRNGHMHPGRPGSLARIARFAGAEEPS